MSQLNELYQEVILDHNRQPRNFYRMEGADRFAEGYNPLCGDRVTIFLKMEGDRIKEVSFLGSGCAISKASCSLMTSSLKGKTKDEAEGLFEKFHQMVTGKPHGPASSELGKLSVFSGVCEFPARVKCATLAWHTFRSALEGKEGVISTEQEIETEIENEEPQDLRTQIIEVLKTCYDPEIPVNIYELGLVYGVDVDPLGGVNIRMTLTSPACPVAGSLPPEVETRVKAVSGVTSAKVEVVWDPPWSPAKMSEAAKLQLGMM